MNQSHTPEMTLYMAGVSLLRPSPPYPKCLDNTLFYILAKKNPEKFKGPYFTTFLMPLFVINIPGSYPDVPAAEIQQKAKVQGIS